MTRSHKAARRGRSPQRDPLAEGDTQPLPPDYWPSDHRAAQVERASYSLPVTPTARERVDPTAERVVVVIGQVGTREKGYIFGRVDPRGPTTETPEVFLHGSAFDVDLFHALLPGDRVTVVLTLGPKGFKGLAGRRWTGNE